MVNIVANKIKVSTTSLAGCFGCHMSFLDIDERIIDLMDLIEFTRTPLTDIKEVLECDIALIEGGVCNSENVELLREFRTKAKIVVALGACAINGGIPSLRNHYTLTECITESYLDGFGVDNPQIPDDPELPLLLNKVHPIHEIVKVDYFLPGCPPSADTIWTFLEELISGNDIEFTYQQIHYD
jgi:NAD-reducing hydrogenase small subunit